MQICIPVFLPPSCSLDHHPHTAYASFLIIVYASSPPHRIVLTTSRNSHCFFVLSSFLRPSHRCFLLRRLCSHIASRALSSHQGVPRLPTDSHSLQPFFLTRAGAGRAVDSLAPPSSASSSPPPPASLSPSSATAPLLRASPYNLDVHFHARLSFAFSRLRPFLPTPPPLLFLLQEARHSRFYHRLLLPPSLLLSATSRLPSPTSPSFFSPSPPSTGA